MGHGTRSQEPEFRVLADMEDDADLNHGTCVLHPQMGDLNRSRGGQMKVISGSEDIRTLHPNT